MLTSWAPTTGENLIVSTKENKALVLCYVQEVLNEGRVNLSIRYARPSC